MNAFLSFMKQQFNEFLEKLIILTALLLFIAENIGCQAFVSSFDDQFRAKEDLFFEIVEPTALRYTFRARPAQNFGKPFTKQFLNIALVVVEPYDACTTLVNGLELRGNIGLVERGGCSFLYKCINGEYSQFKAILIYDNEKSNDELYIDMVDDETKRNCSIPAAFILGKDGHMIRMMLTYHKLNRAIVNIPVNISSKPLHKQRNPPWTLW